MNLDAYQSAGRDLVSRLRLPTDPVGIKYIKSEDEIPDLAVQPTKRGQKWSLCQAFTYARRWGWHCAMTVNDNLCIPGSGFHHWADITSEELVESQVRQGWHTDREAEWKRLESRLGSFVGTEGESLVPIAKNYCGFLCSPLTQTIFEPDSILVFGDGTHMTHLIWALSYDYETPINSIFDGFGETCYKGGLLPFLTGRPQLVLPGMGDRGMAAVQDNELAIGFPATLMKKVSENPFKTGGKMNPGQPLRSTMANNLNERLTPGFKYLREVLDQKKSGPITGLPCPEKTKPCKIFPECMNGHPSVSQEKRRRQEPRSSEQPLPAEITTRLLKSCPILYPDLDQIGPSIAH